MGNPNAFPVEQASSPAGCRTVPVRHPAFPRPSLGNLSNYIKLYQTIEIMNAAPKGKIGRLPKLIQEQVNRRLEHGEQVRTLVA